MKSFKLFLTATVVSFLLAVSTPAVFAASFFNYDLGAAAEAVIDWDSFSISYTGTDYSVSNTLISASAEIIQKEGSTVTHTDSDSTEPASVLTSTGYAKGWLDQTGNYLPFEILDAYAETYFPHRYESAEAGITYSGLISAVDAGTLTISFNYLLAAYTEADMDEWALATAVVMLDIDGTLEADGILFSSEDREYSESDMHKSMTLSIDLSAGDEVSFEAAAMAFAEAEIRIRPDNPVPVPSAIWLLGCGLLGLTARLRKKA